MSDIRHVTSSRTHQDQAAVAKWVQRLEGDSCDSRTPEAVHIRVDTEVPNHARSPSPHDFRWKIVRDLLETEKDTANRSAERDLQESALRGRYKSRHLPIHRPHRQQTIPLVALLDHSASRSLGASGSSPSLCSNLMNRRETMFPTQLDMWTRGPSFPAKGKRRAAKS